VESRRGGRPSKVARSVKVRCPKERRLLVHGIVDNAFASNLICTAGK
jgi:hypothetical protein